MTTLGLDLYCSDEERKARQLDRLERVRGEMLTSLLHELNVIDKEIELTRIRQMKTNSLEGKAQYQLERARLEIKRTVLRHTLFAREDLINNKIDEMIKEG